MDRDLLVLTPSAGGMRGGPIVARVGKQINVKKTITDGVAPQCTQKLLVGQDWILNTLVS